MSILGEDQIIQKKQEYNKVLQRCKKAEDYMNNPDVEQSEKEKWMPNFQRILKQLNSILFCFEQNGIPFTSDEALNGFTEVIK